jgi:hypothetical protein
MAKALLPLDIQNSHLQGGAVETGGNPPAGVHSGRGPKTLITAMTLLLAGAVHGAGVFECKVLDAANKLPGRVKVEPATNNDARILGEVFSVRTKTAEIKGSPIYQTAGHKVEILRSSADQFSVLIRDAGVAEDDDISVITLDRIAGQWTFKHYSSWLGLLTAGSCRES